MRRVHPRELRPGMKLAEPIFAQETGVLLLGEGVVMTSKYLDLLENSPVTPIFVEEIEEEVEEEAGWQAEEISAPESLFPSPNEEWTQALAAIPDGPEKRLYVQCQQSLQEIVNNCRVGKVPAVSWAKEIARDILQSLFTKPGLWLQLSMLKATDPYSTVHSVNVVILASMLAFSAGYREPILNELATGALLHDIGKLDVPLSVLNKPGPLDPAEFALMKEHSLRGYLRVKESNDVGTLILNVVLYHHERNDGSGYPLGLKAERMPEPAMIVAIADVYDALTTDRVYRPRFSPGEGLRMLETEVTRGKLDRRLVEFFIRTVAPYSIGTVVKLNGGEIGRVIGVPRALPSRPILQLLEPTSNRGKVIDLSGDPSISISAIIYNPGFTGRM